MKQMTEVKTIYARVAVVLLAVNFALTGYIAYSMQTVTDERLDAITSQGTVTPTTLSVPESKLDSKRSGE